jgi:hypothetical protein
VGGPPVRCPGGGPSAMHQWAPQCEGGKPACASARCRWRWWSSPRTARLISRAWRGGGAWRARALCTRWGRPWGLCPLLLWTAGGGGLWLGHPRLQCRRQPRSRSPASCAHTSPGPRPCSNSSPLPCAPQVAGAAAAEGRPLQEVAALAQLAADRMGTLGVALTVCTLPGKAPSDRSGARGAGCRAAPGPRRPAPAGSCCTAARRQAQARPAGPALPACRRPGGLGGHGWAGEHEAANHGPCQSRRPAPHHCRPPAAR